MPPPSAKTVLSRKFPPSPLARVQRREEEIYPHLYLYSQLFLTQKKKHEPFLQASKEILHVRPPPSPPLLGRAKPPVL